MNPEIVILYIEKNIKMKIIITFMVSMILLTACFDDKLTIKRVDYTGYELRTDGYYFINFRETSAVMFLYKNGVSLTCGGYMSNIFDEIEKEIIKQNFETKIHWGVFNINGDTIHNERWIESTGFWACLYRKKGYIVNDSTIHFTEDFLSETNKTSVIDQVWHFRQFDNKPDSTNKYIK